MKLNSTFFYALRIFFILMILISVMQTYSQIRVTKVSTPESLIGKKGVVYSLPKTQIYIELQIKKSQAIPGPLADYAKEFLGVHDINSKGAVSYFLENAFITTCFETDPLQVYLVEKEEKSSGEIWISFGMKSPVITMEKFQKELNPQGFSTWDQNLYITPETGQLFKKYSDASTREVIDTIIRRISIDTLVVEEKIFKRSMVGFTDREKALEASDRIRQIEQDKYNLLIGYQETAYSKEALEYMYNKLEEERMEYRKLFTGVEITENLSFRFEIDPDPTLDVQEYVVSGFSRTNGLVPADGQNAIVLSLNHNPVIPGLPAASPAISTGFVYRNPQPVAAVITLQGKEIANKKIEVLQFGPAYSLPPEFKRIEFDLETGSLKTIVLE